VSANKIIKKHLGYGTVKGALEFIRKRTDVDEHGKSIINEEKDHNR